MTAPSCPDKYADELSCVNADDVAVIVRAVRRQATARDDNAAAILVSVWSDRSTLLAKLLAAEAELSRARKVIADVRSHADFDDGDGNQDVSVLRGRLITISERLAAYSTARQTEKL